MDEYKHLSREQLIRLFESVVPKEVYVKFTNDFSTAEKILEMRIQKFTADETEKMLKEINDKWVDKELWESDAELKAAVVPLSNSGMTPPGQPDLKRK